MERVDESAKEPNQTAREQRAGCDLNACSISAQHLKSFKGLTPRSPARVSSATFGKIRMSTKNIGNSRVLRGSCYCGAIRYEVADEFSYAMNCHCSDCRRATGSAFKPFAGIDRVKVRVVAGADRALVFGDPKANHDVHCEVCGSLLFSVVNEGARAHVTLGTLVDEPKIRPSAHIFVGDKAPWFTITDSLPQYEGHVT